jgi:response regulator RpfG family c-di-GMP phosphodiesterase
MDEGISFATSLKQREDVGRIPIMIVSARPDAEKGYKRTIDQDMDWLAADIFMEKPVMPRDLLHNVSLLLGKAG